jgi:hypothetical protein
MSATAILHSRAAQAAKCDREGGPAGGEEGEAEESGMPSHFAVACRRPQSFFLPWKHKWKHMETQVETHGNTWKHVETKGNIMETNGNFMETYGNKWKHIGNFWAIVSIFQVNLFCL